MKHTLIVMMGPAGIGKSYIAKKFEETHEDCIIVSRDKIRFAMLKDEDDYFKYEDEVEKKYYDNVSRALKVHKYVIADATQITKKSRNKLFSNITIPSNTRIVGIWIEGPKEMALTQNKNRSGRALVPEEVIAKMYKYKVSPTEKEPFNEIIYVSREHDLALGKKNTGIESVFDKIKNL